MQSLLVKPTAFYKDDSQKTKLNWFCYEYASEIVSRVDRRLRRRLNRKGIKDGRIVEFAAWFAKHMKVVALRTLAGQFDKVPISYRDVERFFPRIGDKLVDDLLTVVAGAWDSLLEACSECPTRCVSEKDEPAPMFDDPDL